MFYCIIAQLLSLLLDCFFKRGPTDARQDREIRRLRQPLSILHRQHPPPPRLSRWEKLGRAVLVATFASLGRGSTIKLAAVLRLFKPDTVLKWHRSLVRRQWTFAKQLTGGRPATDPERLTLLLRLAQENPTWGYGKLPGALLKLGDAIGRSTVRDILQRQQVPPAPERVKQGSSWRTFLSHDSQQLLACDFFTVETAWLQTLTVFFFIEGGRRRVHFAGCTAHPTAEWVTQPARQLRWTLPEEQQALRVLIRDRDAKFTARCDNVFAAEGIEISKTPFRAPASKRVC